MKQKAAMAAMLSVLVAAAWGGPTVRGDDRAPGMSPAPAAGQATVTAPGDPRKTAPEAGVSTADKLKRIRIAELEFQDSTLAGAVEFLMRAGKEGDTFSPEDQRGINIALSVPDDIKARTIRVQVRNVSLSDALRLVTKLAGVRYEIKQGVVMIVPAKEGAGEEMTTHRYTINQAMLPGIRKTTAKAYFESMGVGFPEGAMAAYNAGLGRVTVVNTAENLKIMDKIVAELGGQVVGAGD